MRVDNQSWIRNHEDLGQGLCDIEIDLLGQDRKLRVGLLQDSLPQVKQEPYGVVDDKLWHKAVLALVGADEDKDLGRQHP